MSRCVVSFGENRNALVEFVEWRAFNPETVQQSSSCWWSVRLCCMMTDRKPGCVTAGVHWVFPVVSEFNLFGQRLWWRAIVEASSAKWKIQIQQKLFFQWQLFSRGKLIIKYINLEFIRVVINATSVLRKAKQHNIAC